MKTTDIIPQKQPTLKQLLYKYRIKNYTVNKDGSVDVDGDVHLNGRGLEQIPIKFRYVSGYFTCEDNHLSTLKNSPIEVGDVFWCNDNELKTLQGAPREVGGFFDCANNALKTLQGAPRYVGESFWCHHNQLTDLQGAPKYVGRDFTCYENRFTKEPDHSFIEIGGRFIWKMR